MLPSSVEEKFYKQKRRNVDLSYSKYVPYTPTSSELFSMKPVPKQRTTIRNPYQELPLEKGLDVSYQTDMTKSQKDLSPYGYVLNKDLSSTENKVFYNPYTNKVVLSVAGTNPLSPRDIGTDLYLAFGGLKQTQRYKESEAVVNKVREQYPKAKKVLIGHSLGSSIISAIAKPNEKVLGFGTGSGLVTPKQSPLEKRYRTAYDPLSYTSGAQIIPSYIPPKKGNLRSQQKVDYPQGILPSHSYQNLKSGAYFF